MSEKHQPLPEIDFRRLFLFLRGSEMKPSVVMKSLGLSPNMVNNYINKGATPHYENARKIWNFCLKRLTDEEIDSILVQHDE